MIPKTERDDRYELFLQYFLRDQSHVFAYVRSLLPQFADAQDVFQRCSLTLWKQFDNFDQERLFLPWACQIALNEVRNFRRVSGRDRLQFSEELVEQLAVRRVESLTHCEKRSSALRACLSTLKQTDRELIQAVYEHAKPVEEIAKSMGKAMQTLYNRLSILRRGLLDCIEKRLAAEEVTG